MHSITRHQVEQLGKASTGNLGILIGGPGTGKTFTTACHISRIIESEGHDGIAVCAPTGKAAVRISEAMTAYGIPIRARTIHSLLKVEQANRTSGWSFAYNRANPLPFRRIFVDESSMIDTDLMAALFAARARGTKLILIGDVNQLPPVGHGAPLRDMIAAGVPYGELTEIHRNDGGIVQACADIRDGKQFKCQGNLHNGVGRNPKFQIDRMFDILNDLSNEESLDRIWDFQIVTAVNKKSELSRRELNKELQKQLNPHPIVEGNPFRLADKVVCVKNGYYPPANKDAPMDPDAMTNDKGDIYVANGELGEVVRIEPKYIVVDLEAPARLIRVPRGGGSSEGEEETDDDEKTGTGCNWDLAYALSVHRSQGSEWPVVIVMLDEYPGARKICDRSWIYTAISRAKKATYLVGNIATAHRFCRMHNIAKRKTFLVPLIQEQLKNAVRTA